ncbi:hypothetical protein ACLOJK_019727 [Asimina triloba]
MYLSACCIDAHELVRTANKLLKAASARGWRGVACVAWRRMEIKPSRMKREPDASLPQHDKCVLGCGEY